MQLQLWPKPCIYISHETETSGSAFVSGDSDLTSWKAIIIYTDIARIDTTIVDDDNNSSLWGNTMNQKRHATDIWHTVTIGHTLFTSFQRRLPPMLSVYVSWHKLTNYPAGKPWFWGRSLSQVIKHVLVHLHWQRTGCIQGHCIGLTGAQVSESKKSLSAKQLAMWIQLWLHPEGREGAMGGWEEGREGVRGALGTDSEIKRRKAAALCWVPQKVIVRFRGI